MILIGFLIILIGFFFFFFFSGNSWNYHLPDLKTQMKKKERKIRGEEMTSEMDKDKPPPS